jgi:hypothetical protein
MGHQVRAVPTVAGGINAIQFYDDGRLTARPVGARTVPRSGWPVDWRVRA